MSDFMIASLDARSVAKYPSAPQPGGYTFEPVKSAPAVTEPKKAGAKPAPKAKPVPYMPKVKCRRCRGIDDGESPNRIVRATYCPKHRAGLRAVAAPLQEQKRGARCSWKPTPCDQIANGKKGGYCAEHKKQYGRERYKRKRLEWHSEAPQTPVPVKEATKEPAPPQSAPVKPQVKPEDKPTAGMRDERMVAAIRRAIAHVAADSGARDLILELFDAVTT